MSGVVNKIGSGGGGGGGSSVPPNVLIRPYTAGVSVGDAVYQTGAGFVDKASAVSTATTPVIGIVSQLDIPALNQCYVVYDGDIMGLSGLTAGEVFILSKQPGQLIWEGDTGNSNYPNTHGNVVQAVGVAMSSTVLQVAVQDQEEI